MDWIYNSRTGFVVQLLHPAAVIQLKSGLGWHGPFNSKQEALDYYTKNKPGNPGWIAPTGAVGALENAPIAVGGVASDALDSTVGKLGLSDENIRSWMIRIGEILLGIVLIGVGIAKLTGTTNFVASAVKAKIS